MWLTSHQVRAGYMVLVIGGASLVGLIHQPSTPKPTAGPTVYVQLPPPPPLPPRVEVRYRRGPVHVPGPVQIVTVTRTVTETDTISVPGPTVPMPGPTRTITVVKRLPGHDAADDRAAPSSARRHGRGHHPKA